MTLEMDQAQQQSTQHAPRSVPRRFNDLLRAFESHGVGVQPGSRLDQMARVFLDRDGKEKPIVAPSDPGFRIAQEAMRDLFTMEPILDVLDRVSLDRDRKKVLKRLMKDPVVSKSNEKASRGRDLQAELLTATRCVRGGMTDVALEEPPDVQATIDGTRWGIAVKRVKRAARVDQNMRDAVDQVERMGGPGVVFLDISVAFNENSTPLVAPSAGAFNEAQQRRLSAIVDGHRGAIFGRSRAKGVGLVYVFDSQLRQTPEEGWALATMTMGIDTSEDLETRKRYLPFKAAFGLGIDRLSVAY